jgi:N6-adenosine-specific RNA methylase IME4
MNQSQQIVLSVPGEITPTALSLPVTLKFEEWLSIGEQLKTCERAVQWWIGDWLCFGERKYGEMYSQAFDEAQAETWKHYKWVSERYQKCPRGHFLSWSHYREAASLDEPLRSELLRQAESENLTVREFQRIIRYARSAIGESQPLPEGHFSLIYADPPWRYEHSMTHSREIENQYPTMELEDICCLKVPASEDSTLFLWATSPKLTEAIEVLEAWEFVYRTCAVWDKEKIGMGYYFRQQHELLLVATRGQPHPPAESVRVSSVIREKRNSHSEKPEGIYRLLESMYPEARRLELFSRQKRQGWVTWGNVA